MDEGKQPAYKLNLYIHSLSMHEFYLDYLYVTLFGIHHSLFSLSWCTSQYPQYPTDHPRQRQDEQVLISREGCFPKKYLPFDSFFHIEIRSLFPFCYSFFPPSELDPLAGRLRRIAVFLLLPRRWRRQWARPDAAVQPL